MSAICVRFWISVKSLVLNQLKFIWKIWHGERSSKCRKCKHMRLRMIPILFTKLNSQTNPIPPQSYPTPIPTMHHDPYVDNSLLGYKTNMNVNHYTSHSYNRTVFRYKYIYLYYITTVLEYIQYEVGIKYKYYIGTYGLKWIFFIQMGYLELQRYDVKKKSILYCTRVFFWLWTQKC